MIVAPLQPPDRLPGCKGSDLSRVVVALAAAGNERLDDLDAEQIVEGRVGRTAEVLLKTSSRDSQLPLLAEEGAVETPLGEILSCHRRPN
ncbi:MAG: hypothetical protein ACRDN8_07325 [Thermoleophilaceae bacterium]